MRVLPCVLVIAHLIAAASGAAQSSRADAGTGLRGLVLAPDGKPVSGGEVVLHTAIRRVSSVIEPTGEFRVVADAPGAHQLLISAPNLAPYRLIVDVPPTRRAMPGTLEVSSAGYERFSAKLQALAADSHAIALVPLPPTNLEAQVVTAAGEAVPDAVVSVFPQDPRVPAHVAVTDAKGVVSFRDAPAGALRLTVTAEKYPATRLDVPAGRRGRLVVVVSAALEQ